MTVSLLSQLIMCTCPQLGGTYKVVSHVFHYTGINNEGNNHSCLEECPRTQAEAPDQVMTAQQQTLTQHLVCHCFLIAAAHVRRAAQCCRGLSLKDANPHSMQPDHWW
jgi:hypothetical protein